LLFGNQMQDYDKRFSILEDRFQQRLRDLEAESSRSLGSLESTMKKQLDMTKIAKGLGAERRGKVSAKGGYFGAMELLADVDAREKSRLAMARDARLQGCARTSSGARRQPRHHRAHVRRAQQRQDRCNLLAGLFVEIAKCLNQDVTPKGGNGIERG
jgi:hypothetical protein